MKTALICVGAGAAGIVQAGQLSAISELGIEYDFITGTSSGSINASVFQQHGSLAAASAWEFVRNKDIYQITPFTLAGIFQKAKGAADSRPLRKFIGQFISRQALKPVPVLISATDEVKRIPFQAYASDLTNDELVNMVWASASIPILFPPVNFNGMSLTDGGLTANAAIREAVEFGAELIYVLIPRRSPPKPVGDSLERLSNLISTFMENMITRELKLIEAYNKVEGKRFIHLCVLKPTAFTNIGLLDFDGLGSLSERKALVQLHKEDTLNQIYKFQKAVFR